MIKLDNLLKNAIEKNASDIHLTVGTYPHIRVNGKLTKISTDKLTVKDTMEFSKTILEDGYDSYEQKGEIDTTYSLAGLARFRVNIYKQRNSDALALRTVSFKVPTLKELEMPSVIRELANKKRGLILVTGPTSCGKSTTSASIINEINTLRAEHIITLEDPIEFLHKHNRSVINQREIGKDTRNYSSALKTVLREDPDVIFIGELNDQETVATALSAAENGHLVISCMNTIGVCKTIERIRDFFPSYLTEQIKTQLSTMLECVISQQLVPKSDGEGRIVALEIMVSNPMIRNLIREGKIYQIESIMQTGSKYGMKTMDMSLVELYKQGIISRDVAMSYATDKEIMERMLMS